MEVSSEMLKDWNGYEFKLLETPDIPKVLAMLETSFYLDEPMSKILGMTEERVLDINQRLTQIMSLDKGTFYAVPKEQPDQVAAVLIIWYQEEVSRLTPFPERSPLTALVRKTVLTLKAKYNIHEERGVSRYPEIFIISTARNHRGKGLATEMYRRAIHQMREEGYALVSSTFTNPLSRRIGEKLGFKQVSRVDFIEIKHEDGSSVYGEEGDKHFIVETILDL